MTGLPEIDEIDFSKYKNGMELFDEYPMKLWLSQGYSKDQAIEFLANLLRAWVDYETFETLKDHFVKGKRTKRDDGNQGGPR